MEGKILQEVIKRLVQFVSGHAEDSLSSHLRNRTSYAVLPKFHSGKSHCKFLGL